MKPYPTPLRRLVELARCAQRRAPAAVPALKPQELSALARRALRARPTSPAVAPTATWAAAFERLCWWIAGAAVAVCLALAVLHPAASEPNAMDLLLQWPATTTPFDL